MLFLVTILSIMFNPSDIHIFCFFHNLQEVRGTLPAALANFIHLSSLHLPSTKISGDSSRFIGSSQRFQRYPLTNLCGHLHGTSRPTSNEFLGHIAGSHRSVLPSNAVHQPVSFPSNGVINPNYICMAPQVPQVS